MTSTNGESTGQGAEDEQAQGAPSDNQGDAQGATQGEAQGAGPEDVEGLRTKNQELIAEKRALQEKVREFEQAAERKAEGEQSTVERLEAKVAGLEASLAERDKRAREQSLRLASVTEAQRLGFRNPDIAYRLIDQTKVEFDDDGNASNIGSLLEGIAKSDAYLLAATDFGGGTQGTSAAKPNDDMNARIRSAVGRS